MSLNWRVMQAERLRREMPVNFIGFTDIVRSVAPYAPAGQASSTSEVMESKPKHVTLRKFVTYGSITAAKWILIIWNFRPEIPRVSRALMRQY